jgi:hypothetical protein
MQASSTIFYINFWHIFERSSIAPSSVPSSNITPFSWVRRLILWGLWVALFLLELPTCCKGSYLGWPWFLFRVGRLPTVANKPFLPSRKSGYASFRVATYRANWTWSSRISFCMLMARYDQITKLPLHFARAPLIACIFVSEIFYFRPGLQICKSKLI